MRRPVFQFGDGLGQAVQVMWRVDQAGFQANTVSPGRVHAFAKPQCGRVVLLRVVHWFEGLRANALNVPEVEELVRSNSGKPFKVIFNSRIRDGDGGAVCMLHSATAW